MECDMMAGKEGAAMETIIREMNLDWRFHLSDVPQAWQKGFEDGDWESVTLPHDWSVTRPLDRNASSGTGYAVGGIGWYRKHFTLSESWRHQTVVVRFDGIYKNSRIWINGTLIGRRPNGYLPVVCDITPFARFDGQDNVLAVRVAHEDVADSRWFTGSGITRKVVLQAHGPIRAVSDGVFFHTEPVASGKAARLVIENELVARTAMSGVLVRNTLLDGQGQVALVLEKRTDFSAEISQKVILEGRLEDPLLWSPESPSLYRLVTDVVFSDASGCFGDGDSRDVGKSPCDPCLLTVDEQPVGIRFIRFDPDEGFFLNGIPTLFKGVCVHHDAGCLGAAVSKGVWRRRLEKLRQCGCNALRMSHNPHMPELYDLCDEMGFLVMDEAFDEWEMPKNKWHKGHNVYPPLHQGYAEDFREWHERDLSAMVRRDRNHPSVVMWSIGNEIDYPNDPYCHPLFQEMEGNNDKNKPAAERLYNPDRPNAERLCPLARQLAAIVRAHDTSRPVTAAVAFPELSTRIGYIDDLDVVGYNYKEHLYAADHARFPHKPLLGSENSHRYQAWCAVKDNAFISGQFLWTGIDYLGECRGWPLHGSQAGLLTTAGFEKPNYWLRKSWWSSEPVVRLFTTNRLDGSPWEPVYDLWDYAPGEMVEIRCFTNQPDVVVRLGGVPVDGELDSSDRGYRSWRLPYQAGRLEATSARATHWLEPTGTAVRLQALQLGEPYGVEGHDEMDDVLQVELTALDAAGRTVVSDRTMIHVRLEGPGVLLGLDNGDVSDVTDCQADARALFMGHLMAYVRKTGSGPLTLVAEGMRMQPAQVVWT
jgi:beta-galactosidase